MVKGSRKTGNVLLEDIGRDVQKIAEGHKTLGQKMDRIEAALGGEIRRLDGKIDLYMRGLRKELIERTDTLSARMNEGFNLTQGRFDGLVARFDAHERAHAG